MFENAKEQGDPPDSATTYHVRRACHGDRDAWTWVVERFTPLLELQARYRLPASLARLHDPEDVVNEVWMVAFTRIQDLRARDGRWTPVLLRFLSTTLLYKVNGLIRKHLRPEGGVREAELEHQALHEVPEELTTILTSLSRSEVRNTIGACLEQLNPEDREIIVLRGIEQVSNQRICKRLNLNRSTVSMRYRRALEKLRARLPDSIFSELNNS